MHEPFLALMREGRLAARLRIDFPAIRIRRMPTPAPDVVRSSEELVSVLRQRLDQDGGIGEFTGGGLDGLRAIARAGWRGEDHSLSLQNAHSSSTARETVNKEIPIGNLRWIISHIPRFTRSSRIARTPSASACSSAGARRAPGRTSDRRTAC
jgi:hypothetical protein